MTSTIVAIVDACRARIFALDKNSSARTTRLIGLFELEQTLRRTLPSARFSETRPGIRRSTGTAHAVDDRRDANIEEHDRLFARDVAQELAGRVADPHVAVLVVAASPNMLGLLRPELDAAVRADVAVHEIGANIARRTVSEIHDFLSKKDMLPPRRRVT